MPEEELANLARIGMLDKVPLSAVVLQIQGWLICLF